MPLIDPKATEVVTIGKDTFVLRRYLGFYDDNLIALAPMNGQGDEEAPMNERITNRRLVMMQKRIVSWTYVEDGTTVDLEIIPDTLKLMPPATARELLGIIDEWDALDKPFRADKDDAEASSGDEEPAPLAKDA